MSYRRTFDWEPIFVISIMEPNPSVLTSYVLEKHMGTFKRLVCAIRGHEEYLHFEKNRVYLECVACGYESPGWTIDNRQPVLHFRSNVVRESRFSAAPTVRPASHALIRTA